MFNEKRVSLSPFGFGLWDFELRLDKSVPGTVQISSISILAPRPLVDHALACDAVWFGGAGRDGTSLIMSGARRKENILQSMVFVNIPGKDT